MKPLQALSATALILASCTSAALATNRASQILTAEIAQSALGAPVEASSRNSMDDTEIGKVWVSNADYKSKSGPPFRSVHVLIRHANSVDEAKSTFESSKATFKGVTVPGIGDACYRTDSPPQLNVLKGSNWMIISCGTAKDPEPAAQEQVARAILPKVPAN